MDYMKVPSKYFEQQMTENKRTRLILRELEYDTDFVFMFTVGLILLFQSFPLKLIGAILLILSAIFAIKCLIHFRLGKGILNNITDDPNERKSYTRR